jgi:hypothetical protein
MKHLSPRNNPAEGTSSPPYICSMLYIVCVGIYWFQKKNRKGSPSNEVGVVKVAGIKPVKSRVASPVFRPEVTISFKYRGQWWVNSREPRWALTGALAPTAKPKTHMTVRSLLLKL